MKKIGKMHEYRKPFFPNRASVKKQIPISLNREPPQPKSAANP
jgi:hypothetical protein